MKVPRTFKAKRSVPSWLSNGTESGSYATNWVKRVRCMVHVMEDAVLDGGDAADGETDGFAIGVLVDDGACALAVEGYDLVLGGEGATEMEGNEGSDSAEANDVDAHRRTRQDSRRWWQRTLASRGIAPSRALNARRTRAGAAASAPEEEGGRRDCW